MIINRICETQNLLSL